MDQHQTLPVEQEPDRSGVTDGDQFVVDLTEPFLRLEFVEGRPDPEVLACEQDVQGEWYGDTPEDILRAYGPWEAETVWLAVRDLSGHALAAARLIRPGVMPQRTLAEAALPPWGLDPDRVAADVEIDPTVSWDVATINVRREMGSAGHAAAAALYHGIFVAPDVNGGRWLLAMMDVRVRRLLAGVGLVFRPLPGARPHPYMGSPALLPVWAQLHRLVGDQSVSHPDEHERITLGRGLDGIEVPGPEGFRLARRPVVDVTAARLPLT